MNKTYFIIILFIVATVFLFSACSQQQTPPTFNEIELIFRNNYEDILIINNFLINSNDISIYNPTLKYAGYDDAVINDEEVQDAIDRLMSNQILKIAYRYGNTIVYILWDNPHDMGCGVAYSINNKSEPDIAFMTELIPLNNDGWYYYVDDYNTWRMGEA